MSGPLVLTTKLNKTFRSGASSVHAVADVSMSIDSGEFIAVLGRSGSGKSTLLHLIGLLARPDSGRFELNGVDVSRLADADRARTRCALIGFVFQSSPLLPRLSAVENVETPLVYAGVRPAERRARAERALARVGMGSYADRWPSQLSGGEQQRVSIARAIVNEPALILADEPTGALDTKSAEEILHLFDDLNRDGRTLCVVTHASEVAAHARRRIVLQDGAVVDEFGAKSRAPDGGDAICALAMS
jgi:putative ABC transport system ATP-binding protein